MKLYYTPGACSQAPHIALREIGATFEPVKVDLVKHTLPDGSDYRAVNPKGYVPLLELDDGSRLTEVQVLLQYVADLKPGTIAPAFGTFERWKLMEWLGFISTEVHKGYAPLWNPASAPDVRERALAALGNRYAYLAETLSKQPYLTGERFSIADAYLFVVTNWAGMHKLDLARFPAIGAFQARMAARPAVHATLVAEGFAK
ncbi:MAG: glutathione transferase GstA [Steroidobacteraceae bacterium]